MIKEIHLSPVGGIRDLRVKFGPGLNVVLGPNEAGKSTLVTALFSALFISSTTRRGSRDWKDYLGRALPYPQGDTARVSLTLTVPGEGDFTVKRSFGEERRARLTLPDGSQISNEGRVQEKIQEALGYGRGTYETVLFARQDEMVETVHRLSESREAMATLGDLLRNLVLRTGGVSVDELLAALEEEERSLLARWDINRDGPQSNRGIDNPYEKGCGSLLMAYYEKERLKREKEDAARLEDQLEEKTLRLRALIKEREEDTGPKLKALEEMEKDIRQRSHLEPKLLLLQEKEKSLKAVNQGWPRAEEKLCHLREQEAECGRRKDALTREQEEAQRVLKGRERRGLIRQVEPLILEIREARKELANLPPLTPGDLRNLEKYQSKELHLKATIEAMKLSGRILSAKPLQVALTSGLEPREVLEVSGEVLFLAAGRVLVEGEGWTVEVKSGKEEVDKLVSDARENRKSFEEKLKAVGALTLMEAREKAVTGENLAQRIRELQGKAELLLREASLEALEEEVAGLPPDKPVREAREISGDLMTLAGEWSKNGLEIKNLEESLRGWQEEFGRYEEVMEALADTLRRILEGRRALENLAPLPEGHKSPEEFMATLEGARNSCSRLDGEIYELKLEVHQKKNSLPQETSEELAEQVLQKDREFARLQTRARALLVLKEEFHRILGEIENQTFAPLAETFSRYLSRLTDHRYAGVQMEGAIPRVLEDTKGKELPLDLLSTGTVGGVALALRLSISEYLLQDRPGFLVMDDPLVNMDPVRRALAALVLQEFARQKQLIVTTCDPGTADLLGGERVELAG